jgi:hypothetical protein
VEQMLRMRTVPCIVSESELLDALEALRRGENDLGTVFDTGFDPAEMARTTRSYARQVGATEVWMARSGRFIWTRLQKPEECKDLLFRGASAV